MHLQRELQICQLFFSILLPFLVFSLRRNLVHATQTSTKPNEQKQKRKNTTFLFVFSRLLPLPYILSSFNFHIRSLQEWTSLDSVNAIFWEHQTLAWIHDPWLLFAFWAKTRTTWQEGHFLNHAMSMFFVLIVCLALHFMQLFCLQYDNVRDKWHENNSSRLLLTTRRKGRVDKTDTRKKAWHSQETREINCFEVFLRALLFPSCVDSQVLLCLKSLCVSWSLGCEFRKESDFRKSLEQRITSGVKVTRESKGTKRDTIFGCFCREKREARCEVWTNRDTSHAIVVSIKENKVLELNNWNIERSAKSTLETSGKKGRAHSSFHYHLRAEKSKVWLRHSQRLSKNEMKFYAECVLKELFASQSIVLLVLREVSLSERFPLFISFHFPLGFKRSQADSTM